MRDFRIELLEDLLAHSGETIDITYLTNKYCGEDDTFNVGDETKSKCRLSINRVLNELKDMKWINASPAWGMSTGHSYNSHLNKRQFILDQPVRVRLTTLGELEYKKSKQEPISINDNSIKIGGDVSGVVNSGGANAVILQNEPEKTGKKTLQVNVWILVVSIIALIALIVIYLLQKSHQ